MLTAQESGAGTSVLPGLKARVVPSKAASAPVASKSGGGDPRTAAAALLEAMASLAGSVSSEDVEALTGRVGVLEGMSGELFSKVKALESREPTTVRYAIGKGPEGPEVKDARPELAKLVKTVACGLVNLYLCGPAGSGKTTLAGTLATALGRPFGAQSFAADVTSSALVGAVDAHGTFRETAFVHAFESGGVYLLDEIDAADSSILLAINAALANGALYLPRHHDPARRIIHRHADTVIVCAANTWGFGADAQYVGRAPLDAAFLDRFVGARMAIDYDRALETSLCGDAKLRTLLWDARAKLAEFKIRRVVSTRAIAAAGRMAQAGWGDTEIKDAIFADWSAQDRERCGVK